MRTVGVKLEADTAGYERNMGSAAKVTAEVDRAADQLGKTSTTTGRKVDGLGGDLRDTGRDAQRLKDEIRSLERSLAGLAAEFAATSSAADRIDLTKAIRKQQGELRQLLKVQKLLPSDPEIRPATQSVARKLMMGLAEGVATNAARSPLITAIAAAGIAAAPVLVPALSAAVSAGVGAGLLGVGVALAAKDPLIEARGKAIGANFVAGLQQEASRAFQGPLLTSLDKFEAFGMRTTERLGKAFDSLAPSLGPLADSLIKVGDRLGASLVKAADSSGPALKGLGDSLVLLSDGVGNFIDLVSSGGPEAASNLRLVAGATADLLSQTGLVIKLFNELSNNEWLTGPLLPLLRKHYDDAAGGAKNLGIWVEPTAKNVDVLSRAMARGTVTAEDLTAAQAGVTEAQKNMQGILEAVGGKMSASTMRTNGLRQAMDGLFGASMRQADANQVYEASWDGLSAAVKTNSRSLDIHTAAGRNNRDALKGLLTSTNDLYVADIAAGDATGSATKKHRERIAAVKEEARRLGLNKTATDELINTYGRIPGKKTTDLVLDGVKAVATALDRLYRLQRALALGININLVEGTGTAKAFKAAGGPIEGPGPRGVDSVHIMAAPGEHMLTADEVDKAGGHEAVYSWRRQLMAGGPLPGYANGGQIAPVDTSRHWPFPIDMHRTKVMSQAQAEAKIIPAGPFGGGGQTLDFIIRAVHSRFPGMRLISGYRPGAHTLSGNLSLHALHRAADWPASHDLAVWWNQNYMGKTKEFISPWNDLNIHNGQRHAYTGAIYRQHSGSNAHDHIAMAGGGVIPEPVFGVGASGRTYSFAENGPERVLPTYASTSGGGGGSTVVNNYWTVNVPPTVNKREIGREIVEAVQAYQGGSGNSWQR